MSEKMKKYVTPANILKKGAKIVSNSLINKGAEYLMTTVPGTKIATTLAKATVDKMIYGSDASNNAGVVAEITLETAVGVATGCLTTAANLSVIPTALVGYCTGKAFAKPENWVKAVKDFDASVTKGDVGAYTPC